MSDGMGSFLYFWLMLGAELIPVISLALMGVNPIVVFLFFGISPIVGIFAGYFFKRYRFAKNARDLDQIIKRGQTLGIHIGKDNVLTLIGGRRGATGRTYFNNMDIYSETAQKSTYTWKGTSSPAMIIKSDMDAPVPPEFIAQAQAMLENSDQIGGDGVKKDPRKVMSILVSMKEREELLDKYEEARQAMDAKRMTLEEFLYEHYRPILFKDGETLDAAELARMKSNFEEYMKNSGERIQKEKEELKGTSVKLKERNLEIEWERDTLGGLIGAHFVKNTVLNLSNIRMLWPSGGGAEDAHISNEQGKLAQHKLEGENWFPGFMKWFGPFMVLVGFGIAVVLILHGA